jgi:hypothetical protein
MIYSASSGTVITYFEHFIDFLDFGGINTTLQVEVQMYNASGVVVASASTSQLVMVSTNQPV